jgi:hypothetical protein
MARPPSAAVPPIYRPEVAARGILYAADHPGRKTYWVGGTTAATLIANRVVPALLDWYLARTGYDSQQTDALPAEGRPDNLFAPADGPDGHDYGAAGEFDDRAHDRSLQMWLSHHAQQVAAAGAVIAGGAIAARAGRHR